MSAIRNRRLLPAGAVLASAVYTGPPLPLVWARWLGMFARDLERAGAHVHRIPRLVYAEGHEPPIGGQGEKLPRGDR